MAVALGFVSSPGCAPTFAPSVANEPVALAPDEGILVLDIDSDAVLHQLQISSYRVIGIQERREVRLLRVKAGRYTLRSAERIVRGGGVYDLYMLEGATFEVRAGHINYPGRLFVRHERGRRRYRARLLNRSGETLAILQERFPIVVASYPVRFAGLGRDDFLIEYSRARQQVEGDGGDPSR